MAFRSDILLRAVMMTSVGVALLLITIKFFAWQRTHSLGIEASLLDSLLDAFASLINLTALHHALKPADEEHRFGHGKIEALASLCQAIIICGSAIWLFKDVIMNFISPRTLHFDPLAIWVMGASTALTLFLVLFQRYALRHTNSLVVASDKLHYETDLLSNLAVMGAFIGSVFFKELKYIDAITASIIYCYILHGSYGIARSGIRVLLDHELSSDIVEHVRKIALEHPYVLGVHDLRTRSAGYQLFVQMHIDMNERLTLKEAHAISDEIEQQIQQHYPHMDVIIHQDPLPPS